MGDAFHETFRLAGPCSKERLIYHLGAHTHARARMKYAQLLTHPSTQALATASLPPVKDSVVNIISCGNSSLTCLMGFGP